MLSPDSPRRSKPDDADDDSPPDEDENDAPEEAEEEETEAGIGGLTGDATTAKLIANAVEDGATTIADVALALDIPAETLQRRMNALTAEEADWLRSLGFTFE